MPLCRERLVRAAEIAGLHARRLRLALRVDARAFGQILLNLLSNAVKFTERGRISLAVSAAPAGRGRVRLTFALADSGIGMTAEEIGRLFRPFAQANDDIGRRYGGAGLGMLELALAFEVLGEAAARKGLKLVWFATGRDDFMIETSRATVEVLRNHGFDVEYKETEGGHTWDNWRDYLNEIGRAHV